MLSRFLLIILVLINFLLIGWFMSNSPVVENNEPALSATNQGTVSIIDGDIIELQLLTELDPTESFGNRCATIGPLESTTAVRRLRNRLTAYISRIRERRTEARVERGYWVYLPIAESRDAAIEYASQLASMGINDYFVVASGEMQNAVSLGLFNDLPNAEKRQKQLQALGFNPRLGARREYETRYWLDYQLLDDIESPWKNISRSARGAHRFSIQCWEEDSPEIQADNVSLNENLQ